MTTFIKKLYDFYRSREKARPSLYMFEAKIYKEGWSGWNEIEDDHAMFTDKEGMRNTKKVFEICNIDFKELPLEISNTLLFEARRTKLYKISDKIIKQYFCCESADDFYSMINFARYHENDAGEEFFEKDDLFLVYSDGEFFVGFGQKQLKDIIVEPEKNG